MTEETFPSVPIGTEAAPLDETATLSSETEFAGSTVDEPVTFADSVTLDEPATFAEPVVLTEPLSPSTSGFTNFFDRIRETGLVRTQDRWCAGVAGGIAKRMGWDPTLVRGVLFVSTFLTGLGLILYGLGWALLPEESDGRIHLQEATRGRFDSALLGAGLVFLMGLGRHGGALSALGHGLAVLTNVVTTGLLVFAAVYLIRNFKERRRLASGDSVFPLGTSAGQVPMTTASPREAVSETATIANEDVLAQSVLPDDELEASITNPERDDAIDAQPDAASIDQPDGATTKAEAKASLRELRAQERAAAEQEKAALRYARAVEKAKTPIVKGPGAAVTGGTFGLILLLGAAAMAAGQAHLAIPAMLAHPALWLGGMLAVLGAVVIISGFRGRRGGLLNLFGILALIAVPVTTFAAVELEPLSIVVPTNGPETPDFGGAMRVVDGDIVVADRTRAERGFQIGFGDPVIDLTELPLNSSEPVTVPISLRAGDLTIIVPDDAAVGASIRLLAGEINWEVDRDNHDSLSQVGRGRTELQSEEVRDDSPALSLWIDAGFGNVTIKESQR